MNIQLSEMIASMHVEDHGNVFGGQLISWMDIAAGMLARKYTKCTMQTITANIEGVHFLAPVRLGQIAHITAIVNQVWNSSMEIKVSIISETILTGVLTPCCHGYFIFVGIVDGRPSKLPPLVIDSDADRIRAAKADQRRSYRNSVDNVYKVNEKDNNYSVVLMKFVMPEHINVYGITFGGQILSWMEQGAFLFASRNVRERLLTASIDHLKFTNPTKVGDLIRVCVSMKRVFRHSVEVYVRVSAENENGTQWTNDGWVTFVAVDENGKVLQREMKGNDGLTDEEIAASEERMNIRLNDKKRIIDEFDVNEIKLE